MTLQLFCPYNAKSVSKGIAAERDRRIARDTVNLLHVCAGSYCSLESCFEVVNAKVYVYRRPVSLVPADVAAWRSGRRPRRLSKKADDGIALAQYGVARMRTGSLHEAESIAKKLYALLN